MNILLTNDDGYLAPGIKALQDELGSRGHKLTLVAPLTQQSAKSHSITLFQPIKLKDHGKDVYSVAGTPTDCMIVANQKVVYNKDIDLVVSGINCGSNMGEDVLYSGTVAAAIEAMFLGYKAIAISINSFTDEEYSSAAKHLADMIDSGIVEMIGEHEILNVNCPNVKFEDVKGIKLTSMGKRKYQNFLREGEDENGELAYFIGGDTPIWEDSTGSDFNAVSQDYISVTPLSPDFTQPKSFEKIQNWIDR